MESEENPSIEQQNSEINISVENSSSLKNTIKKPPEKQANSESASNPENNQKYEIKDRIGKKVCDAALKEGVLLTYSWYKNFFKLNFS